MKHHRDILYSMSSEWRWEWFLDTQKCQKNNASVIGTLYFMVGWQEQVLTVASYF